MEALTAARDAGASYTDVRVGRYRRQSINTRERQVSGVSDNESYGLGVRTLVNGCWGFAATSTMTRAGAQNAARDAAVLSRAARTVQNRRVELAPVTPAHGTWITPVRRDPIEVPLEDKIALLLAANEAALKVKGVRFVNSGLALLREVKTLVTSEGTNVTQTMIRVGPSFSGHGRCGRRLPELRRRRSRPAARAGNTSSRSTCPATRSGGRRWPSRSSAPGASRPARWDVILEPTNLWLTIHESIGHPTELDRAIGEEANYAGTSFIAPPEKVIGQLKYGPAFMNVQADRTQEGSLSRVAWDDEGVPADQWLLIEKGIFKDYQTTREQVARIQKLTGVSRSHGCSFAESWDAVQFQRMPNISLLPGDRDIGLDEIIAATERGIVIRHTGSWSIDHQRYNFQFSGQVFHEVRNGQGRRHAARRRLPEHHAGLLEFDGHDWRAGRPTGWAARSMTARASRRRSIR